MTSSYGMTGGYGGQTSSTVAGALGATGTAGSSGMPGMTANGTLATASPSVQPYAGAAAPHFDTSILFLMLIGIATGMMLL